VAQLGHLTHDDVDQAAALSRGVGWNQTPDDWARLLTLAPDGVFGAFEAGRLVATSSVVAYGGALAWIGMMIVNAAYRGRGLGKQLLDAALASPTVPPGATIGLDATDMGAPLYRTRAFVDVDPIDRWGGVLRAPPAPGGTVPAGTAPARTAARAVGPAEVAWLAAWDAERAGTDRSALVAHLLRSPDAFAVLAQRGDRVVGYAAVRPGRTHHHLGPVVADDDDAFDALLAAVAHELTGEPVFADAVRGDATDAAFARAGLRVERRLTRMTLTHPRRVLSGAPIWATAGLEWG
jgi:ribosomal protein S18 acetylase RimI-like enzyme